MKYLTNGSLNWNATNNMSVGSIYHTSITETYLVEVKGKDELAISAEEARNVIEQYIGLLLDAGEGNIRTQIDKKVEDLVTELKEAIRLNEMRTRSAHAMGDDAESIEREKRILQVRLTKLVYSLLPQLPAGKFTVGDKSYRKKTDKVYDETRRDGFYLADYPQSNKEDEVVGVYSAWTQHENLVSYAKKELKNHLGIKVYQGESGHWKCAMLGYVVWEFLEPRQIEGTPDFMEAILDF